MAIREEKNYKDSNLSTKFTYHLLSPLDRTKEEIGKWGNHMSKYRMFIEQYFDDLVECLEENNLIDEVNLIHNLPDIDQQVQHDMGIISGLEVPVKSKLNYLGVYYALKLVQMNIRGIDFLRAQLQLQEPLKVYEKYMRELGWRFRAVTAAFLDNIMKIHALELEFPDFTLVSVGTRADQDDIDVAIITETDENADQIDRLFSRINKTMTKFSSPLHFHIAESLDNNKFSSTIVELKDFVLRNISNFVVVTEILSAKRILGSEKSMVKFEQEVINLFYPQYSEDYRYHEAYLRIILGETNLYLARSLSTEFIHPKNDALRMVKGLLSVLKTRYGIVKKNAWSIIDRLKEEDTKHWDIYTAIGESLAFFETVRFLYMLYGIQEEMIVLNVKETRENLQRVGEIMGIGPYGAVSCIDHLLMKYYEHLNRIKKIAEILMDECKVYLGRITAFKNVLVTGKGNIALEFARHLQFFQGSRYWEDLFKLFNEDQANLIKEFARNYLELPDRKRRYIIRTLFSSLETSFDGLLKFIIYLDVVQDDRDLTRVHQEFVKNFFSYLSYADNSIELFLRFFKRFPVLMNRFLIKLDKKQVNYIIENVLPEQDKINVEYTQAVYLIKCLKSILEIYGYGSWHFRKYFQRISSTNPDLIQNLGQDEQIEEVCAGIFADVSRTADRSTQKELLGQFYDLEFIHTGLKAIRGRPYQEVANAYIGFTETYLRSLFDVCKLEIESIQNKTIGGEDQFLLCTVGSNARGSSYNDDLDLVAILDSDDPELFYSYNKILSKISREIVKRGLIPQFRFADYLGNYVTRIYEIQELLNKYYPSDFIEISQIIEAKPIVSSVRMIKVLYDTITKPYILNNWKYYARKMVKEIKARKENIQGFKYDIKESPGGIRDIEMLLLIFKARYDLKTFSSIDTLTEITEIDQKNSEYWEKLYQPLCMFKELRQLMRLTVAMDNVINFSELCQSVRFLQCDNQEYRKKELEEMYLDYLEISGNCIDKIISNLESEL